MLFRIDSELEVPTFMGPGNGFDEADVLLHLHAVSPIPGNHSKAELTPALVPENLSTAISTCP